MQLLGKKLKEMDHRFYNAIDGVMTNELNIEIRKYNLESGKVIEYHRTLTLPIRYNFIKKSINQSH